LLWIRWSQWGIYENCDFDNVVCDGACIDFSNINIVAPLQPCTQYWLWIDGCNMDVCDINFIVNDGFSNAGMMNINFYEDADMDGFGDPESMIIACSQPSGYVSDNTDCDDTNANVNPDAMETCDDIDNNCDGEIDENLSFLNFYADNDMDGFGNPNALINDCEQPQGYVLNNTDCDDTNANINPDAIETCDGIDNNCNIDIDEGLFNDYYADVDMDGFGDPNVLVNDCEQPQGYVLDNTDCDDTNADINPDAIETCDAIDNNCNNEIDEGLTTNNYYADNDMDGYGDPNVLVNDCEQPQGYVLDNTDCDDTNADINPDAIETCDDVDNNCNNQIDEGLMTNNYYADNDMDGYGDPDVLVNDCGQPQGYVLDNTDCDDTNADINPDADDIPNNDIDEDCDGMDAISGTYDINGTTIKIFPNPTSGIVNIEMEESIDVRLELFDIQGKNLLIQNTTSMDLTHFQNGLYILRLSTPDERYSIVERIVVNR